ncbi:phage tail tape measure protein [Pseudomonas syringae]|uniref:Tail tape measure protein n=9 Tax=Pseudomonas syringae TaxID=317 RepID=A0A3M4K071_PSESF|nr:phage tail tape measure protein [Pseudomonas syringae]EPN21327.1 tail tape measure protein [Pseudomonas syringae pv. actinidiae ICMP 19100]KTC49652.1 tail tape measure protein [Pseudomonas syringae pv. actinidiae ICMP 19497]OOK94550.1 phage tail tape measure protein [Pseudomonas syringae pv. actinidifoliorum]RMQ22662.1 Tail tape measure protein [Pseudomonas syringae pv. actinidiae]UYS83859.1 phage tail tape measure protein [Pseudomonas syringae pv. actinidifoliorum ICMP 18803]
MASRSLGTLTLDLIARIGGFQQNMDRASQSVTRTGAAADAASARVSAMQGQMLSLSNMASSLAGPLASAFSLSAIYKASEAYTSLTSRLKLVTESSAELATAQNAVFSIAQSAYQPLSATAELYQRIATNQKELKLSGEGVAGVVGTISKTLAISGASADSANAALIQLGQAFASGMLRGEELNSVMEQAPALAQAIAAGMGKTVGELRALGAAGLLTADSVVKALQAQEKAVADLFNKTAVTIGNSLTATSNSLTQFIGRMDQASGVSAAISANIVKVSQSIDGLTKDFGATSKTFEQVSSAAETLAYIIGARLAVATAQGAAGFVMATKASIQQAAALAYSAAANWKSVEAEAATTRQTLASMQAKQADAKVMLQRANLEILSAEQKVASDRLRQQSEINNLKAVQITLAAEREQEATRLANQISEQGRAAARNRMALARLDEVAIIKNIQAAEAGLAATTAAASVDIQAAYAARSAAAAGYAETTLAANAAVKASERAAAAATVTNKSIAAVSTAGGALMGLLTGPVGMIAMTALVAASFIDFGGAADKASKSLIDHNLTLDQSIQKYKELSAEQQRYQVDTWQKAQKEALNDAASDLENYTIRTQLFLGTMIGDRVESQKQFNRMLAEVKDGARSLDSVTQWSKDTAGFSPELIRQLTEMSASYSANTKEASAYKTKIEGVDASMRAASASATGFAAAQAQAGGQTKGQIADFEKYIAKLIETRNLFGANAEAQAAYAADQMKLTTQQREQAKVISQQQDVLEKYKEAVKDNDKVQQEALKRQLIGLYSVEQAAIDAAAATKLAHDDSAKAAKESANKQIEEIRRVIDAAANITKNASFLTGRNMLIVPPTQTDVTGRSMVLPGVETPKAGKDPRTDPTARANAAIAQINETTDPNKGKGEKKYQEDAALKVLDQARQQYAVLKEQSALLGAQKGDIDKIGTASRELIKWEQELADIKSKQTLTAEQKSLLVKQESITADLKRNAALEKENELRKIALDEAKKLSAFQASVNESNRSAKSGFSQQLVGAGMGDKQRAHLQEMLAIEEDFNKQQRDLVLQRNTGDISDDLYNKETDVIRSAMIERLQIQRDYYSEVDVEQSKWMDGVDRAWQNYVNYAQNYSAQAADFVSGTLSDATNGLGDMISDIATKTKTASDAVGDFLGGMAKSTINALTDMAAQWVIYQGIQLLTAKSGQSAAATGLIANAQAASAQAALNAYASTAGIPLIGPGLAPAAALAATAATTPMVAAVSASALAGMAHNGLDNIPKEGTWLLDGGERVLNPNQNRDLTKYLADKSGNGAGGAPSFTINAPVNVQAQPGMTDADAARQGSAISSALEAQLGQFLEREMRQGGRLWRRT